MVRALVVVALVSACVQTSSVSCPDGSLCPSGTTCKTVAYDTGSGSQAVCADAEQLSQCSGKSNGDACTTRATPGGCHDGVCLPAACGNSFVDPGEACDDGNTTTEDATVAMRCSSDCRSNETCGNKIVDVATGEQCDEANHRSHDGCADNCITETPAWTQLGDERPGPREAAAMAYDDARRTVMLFGGNNNGVRSNMLNEWDGRSWRVVDSGSFTPVPRSDAQFAYDRDHDQLLLFSGDITIADMWSWHRGRWSLVTESADPGARADGAMYWDGHRHRVRVFGGGVPLTTNNIDDAYAKDLWEWDGVAWTQVATTGMDYGRFQSAFTYDPKRDVLVVYGGQVSPNDNPLGNTSEVWELSGTTWTNKTPASGGPGVRNSASMAYDPISGHEIVAGGISPATGPMKDTWIWDGSTWTQGPDVPTANPFRLGAIATDPVRQRIVLVDNAGELFEWNGSTWTQPADGTYDPSVPAPVRGASFALDSKRGELFLFGGSTANDDSVQTQAAWTWRGGWTNVTPAGTSPSPRLQAAMTYDPKHDQMVLYGGCAYDGAAMFVKPVTDTATWLWNGTAWTSTTPATNPGVRCQAASSYDAKRGNVVLFGGSDGTDYPPGTFTWDGATWTQITGPSPNPGVGAAMAYDPVHEYVLLFGGQGASPNGTWTWDGATWTELAPPTSPPERQFGQLAWDGARQRLVLTGGLGFSGINADSWEWDGTTWTLLPATGPARVYAGGAQMPDGFGVALFGGSDVFSGGSVFGDLWRLRWNGDTAAYEACTDHDGDGDGLVGCADPDCAAVCATCGDHVCDPVESCTTCPGDCGACPTVCGDGVCGAGESCPGDCP